MNPRLNSTQIDEILAAAEHVDVPAEQLVAAAAEIRATLLAASDDAALLVALPIDGVAGVTRVRRVDPMRRARAVRTALVAAALTLAVVLSAAVAGALPDPVQERVAQVASFFGVDLPSDSQPAAGATTGVHDPASTTRDTETGAPKPGPKPGDAAAHSDGQDENAGSTSLAASGPTVTTAGASPTVVTNGPPDDPGSNGNGPPADPGNSNGPPEDPGNGNGCNGIGNCYGNGNGNGNGPPVDPGNGNGNGCNGDGNCYGQFQ